jgi:hypothetical protein
MKYVHRKHLTSGVHSWNLAVMPDCYYGFDIERIVKFTVEKDSQAGRRVIFKLI